MDLTLLFDHRFCADDKNVIFSLQNYNYDLFADRYLPVFDNVRIVARIVQDVSRECKGHQTEGPGVEVVSLGNWTGPFELALQSRTVLSELKRQCDEGRTALIMIAPGMLGSLMYTRLQRQGRPYGMEVVGDPYDTFAPNAIKHPLRPLIRQFASHILKQQCYHATAVTYVTAKYLQRRYPPNPQSFATYSSDVEVICVEEIPPIDVSKQQFTLINVGTMAQLYKGQDVLIEAITICLKQGLNISLILVGDGKYRSRFESLARNFGICDHVKFCGQLPAGDAVRQQLDMADLFVMPSQVEGLPRAMIEAMARGLPCIGTSIGGIPELLEAEDLVSVNDSHALAQKIREVLLDPERRKQMAERNLHIAKQYQPEIMQGRREAFYRQLKEKTAEWIQQQQLK